MGEVLVFLMVFVFSEGYLLRFEAGSKKTGSRSRESRFLGLK